VTFSIAYDVTVFSKRSYVGRDRNELRAIVAFTSSNYKFDNQDTNGSKVK